MNAVTVEVVRFQGGPLDGRERTAWRSRFPARAYVKWIDGGFSFLDATVHEVQPEGFERYDLLVARGSIPAGHLQPGCSFKVTALGDDPRVAVYQWHEPALADEL